MNASLKISQNPPSSCLAPTIKTTKAKSFAFQKLSRIQWIFILECERCVTASKSMKGNAAHAIDRFNVGEHRKKGEQTEQMQKVKKDKSKLPPKKTVGKIKACRSQKSIDGLQFVTWKSEAQNPKKKHKVKANNTGKRIFRRWACTQCQWHISKRSDLR